MSKIINGDVPRTRLPIKKSTGEIIYNENLYLNTNSYKDHIDTELSAQITETKIKDNFINLEEIENKSGSLNIKLNINNNYYNTNIKIIEDKGLNKDLNQEKDNCEGGVFKDLVTILFGTEISLANTDKKDLNETEVDKKYQHKNVNKKNRERKKKSKTTKLTILFIQCTNCNNLISMENVEEHSNICTKVKEEVFKNENSISIFQSIDYKLKKLLTNIQTIKSLDIIKNSDLSKDIHSITLLEEYIFNSINLCYLNHTTTVAFKNLITNIDALIFSHKGSTSTLILLEKAKVLAAEKFRIVKEDMRKMKDTEKSNIRKSGCLAKNSNKEFLDEIKKEIEEETKKKQTAEIERDNYKRKVNALRKMNDTQSPRNLSISRDNDIRNSHTLNPNQYTKDNSKILNTTNELDDIISNYETVSRKSFTESDFANTSYSRSIKNSSNNIIEVPTKDNEINTPSCLTDSKRFLLSPISLSKNTNYGTGTPSPKNLYQEFVGIVLKIKFEKLNRFHKGQFISEKEIWNESIRENIEMNKWMEFIIQELNNPEKYEELQKNKVKKGYGMDIIQEEVTYCN